MIIDHQKQETITSLNFLDEGNKEAQFEDSKFWELESGFQILDVKGRLKQSLSFWKNILGAPPPVIDCIENTYRLPLKFLPPPLSQNNH